MNNHFHPPKKRNSRKPDPEKHSAKKKQEFFFQNPSRQRAPAVRDLSETPLTCRFLSVSSIRFLGSAFRYPSLLKWQRQGKMPPRSFGVGKIPPQALVRIVHSDVVSRTTRLPVGP